MPLIPGDVATVVPIEFDSRAGIPVAPPLGLTAQVLNSNPGAVAATIERDGSGCWSLVLTPVQPAQPAQTSTSIVFTDVDGRQIEAPPVPFIVAPKGAMTAVITVPAQPGYSAGTFTVREADAEPLDPWIDPRGQFTLTLRQALVLPGLRAIFARSIDGKWGAAQFWLGDATVANPLHMSRGYSVSIAGDFAGEATVPNHWWGSRWRISGNAANGLRPGRNDWPYPLTDYATLVAERLIPEFDPVQTGGRAPPAGEDVPYTLMGNGPVGTGMASGGGRPDIGLFNEWSCHYFLTQAPTATAAWKAQAAKALDTLMAVNEAGASIPWFINDPARGCMWERLVNHAGEAMVPEAPTMSHMPLIATGPPGALLCESVSDSNHPNSFWWVAAGAKIPLPASGTMTIDAHFPGQVLPTGTPVRADAQSTWGDPAITYAWGDPSQFVASSPWGIDSAHQPELGYLSFLLFRDPWDLHTIQADAMCSANTYPSFTVSQVRQLAWDYAHAVQAWAATPANAPSWLLPKATLDRWVRVIQQWLFAHVIDHQTPGLENLASVFHTMYSFLLGDSWRLNNGTVISPVQTLIASWEDAFCCQAAAFAAIVRPDADTMRIAAYSAQGLGDRFGGSPDWPRGARTIYITRVCSAPNLPYASLKDAWAGFAPGYWAWVANANNSIPDPLPGPPADMGVDASKQDYPSGDLAGLALAVQAGLVQFRPQRDWLATSVVPAGVNFNRAFALV